MDEKKEDKVESKLDSLLDEALEDFNKPLLPKSEGSSNDVTQAAPNGNIWTEEFIQEATKNFELTMRQMMESQKTAEAMGTNPSKMEQGGKIDFNAMPLDFMKFAEVAKTVTGSPSDKDFAHCLADTMQQMAISNEEVQSPPSADDLGKMFANLGFDGSQDTGTPEVGGLYSLMQTMLENILSKDVLYQPIQEIVSKYPDWLADNRSNLSDEDFNRYNKQYGTMKEVALLFEKESEEDSPEEKTKNHDQILMLMQKLQNLGEPPKDLVGDIGSLLNFDSQGNPVIPDLSALLGSVGLPPAASGQAGVPEGTQVPSDQCLIM